MEENKLFLKNLLCLGFSNKESIKNLKKGLYLDDSKILIPWLISVDELPQYASPTQHDKAIKPSGLASVKLPHTTFNWVNTSWCGLPCNIETRLANRIPNASQWYHIPNLSSYVTYFRLSPIPIADTVQAEFYRLKKILKSHFGYPTAKNIKGKYDRKSLSAIWEIEDIKLLLVTLEGHIPFNDIVIQYTAEKRQSIE